MNSDYEDTAERVFYSHYSKMQFLRSFQMRYTHVLLFAEDGKLNIIS